MTNTGLHLLDAGLTLLHFLIIAINVFGWMWPRARKAHLVVVAATTFSWLVLGIWKGLGYCPVTDWQWRVKTKLGEHNLPNSFITYYAQKITGRTLNPAMVDTVVSIVFAAVVIITIYVNFVKKKRQSAA